MQAFLKIVESELDFPGLKIYKAQLAEKQAL
jgi:hypothetical protein